jgi:hypothetical protein
LSGLQTLSIGNKSQKLARNSRAETRVQLSVCRQLSLQRAVQYLLIASIISSTGALIWAATIAQRLPPADASPWNPR